MSFADYEVDRVQGRKTTLYHFYYVNNEEFLYTDSAKPVTRVDFETPFLPVAISRGAVTSSGSLDKANLEIRLSRDTRLVESFRAYPPNEVVNIVVYEFHENDPAQQALVVWSGRVIGHSVEGEEARFQCEPITTSLRRAGLRRHYQLGCPHALFGAQCGAARLAATTPAIAVVAASGSAVQLPEGWLPAGWGAAGKTPDKFVGGLLTWQFSSPAGPIESKRTILRVLNGVTILTAGPVEGLVAGGNVKLILGCNHQMTDCQAIHNNIKNYGGQPFIPNKSPFGFVNHFY